MQLDRIRTEEEVHIGSDESLVTVERTTKCDFDEGDPIALSSVTGIDSDTPTRSSSQTGRIAKSKSDILQDFSGHKNSKSDIQDMQSLKKSRKMARVDPIWKYLVGSVMISITKKMKRFFLITRIFFHRDFPLRIL